MLFFLRPPSFWSSNSGLFWLPLSFWRFAAYSPELPSILQNDTVILLQKIKNDPFSFSRIKYVFSRMKVYSLSHSVYPYSPESRSYSEEHYALLPRDRPRSGHPIQGYSGCLSHSGGSRPILQNCHQSCRTIPSFYCRKSRITPIQSPE